MTEQLEFVLENVSAVRVRFSLGKNINVHSIT